jgi:hypothetical protein
MARCMRDHIRRYFPLAERPCFSQARVRHDRFLREPARRPAGGVEGVPWGKVPYYIASHTNPHTTLHLNKNREDLRQRKVHEPLAVVGRGHASLLINLDTVVGCGHAPLLLILDTRHSKAVWGA